MQQLRAQTIALARRMDWYRGLRAACALSTPLLIADMTGLTHMGWAALGGIEAIVTDAGGPYRVRLGRLSVLTLGGALGVFLGTLAGNELIWALPVTLVFCFTWTYLTALGQPFASASLLVQVIYACGLGEPSLSLREALLRGGFLLLGGLWATVLSLFLWPIDPYRPARAAIGYCYSALAGFLQTTANFRANPPQNHASSEHAPSEFDTSQLDPWHRANLQHKILLRRLIEQAWDAVASVRAESQAETAQGRQLIVLLETADLILERCVGLAEHTIALAEVPAADASQISRAGTQNQSAELESATLAQLQHFLHTAATLLTRRRASLPATKQPAASRSAIDALREQLSQFAQTSQPPDSRPDAEFFALQTAEIASNLDTAFETTEALLLGIVPNPKPNPEPNPRPDSDNAPGSRSRPGTSAPTAGTQPAQWSLASIRSLLAFHWRPSSLILRHAARVALVCGFDVCLIDERHVGHGYWLILTSIIVLQPHVSGTLRKGMQRVSGTVGGGIIAALLALVLHSQLVTGIVLFPFALLALALLPVNYAAYAFFVTPAFVLAFLHRTGEWQLAFLRIGNTVAGAAIAIAAMTVLFPSYERERIANYLRASLVANRRYLEVLVQLWTTTGQLAKPDSKALSLARRATGLAHNDMEESLERILAESWGQKASSENLLAFAAYMHRFSQTVTGLATLPETPQWKHSRAIQFRLAAILDRMHSLEADLAAVAPDAESELWPRLPFEDASISPAPEDLPGERQIRRLERQTQIMHRHLESLRNEPWLLRP